MDLTFLLEAATQEACACSSRGQFVHSRIIHSCTCRVNDGRMVLHVLDVEEEGDCSLLVCHLQVRRAKTKPRLFPWPREAS